MKKDLTTVQPSLASEPEQPTFDYLFEPIQLNWRQKADALMIRRWREIQRTIKRDNDDDR